MSHRPLLYLDIDGVLLRERPNAVRARDASEVARHALLFRNRSVSAPCTAG